MSSACSIVLRCTFLHNNMLVINDYILVIFYFLIQRRSNVLVHVCVVTVWIGALKLQHSELDWLTPVNAKPYMFTKSTCRKPYIGNF